MAKQTLSDRKLKSLKAPKDGKRFDIMDTAVPGFGVRVSSKGKVTFVLVVRYPGSTNPTRRALGEYGELTLAKAREKAQAWLALLRLGIDPKEEEDRLRREKAEQRENTLRQVIEDFIKRVCVGSDPEKPKERKGNVVARELHREFVSRFGDRPVSSITRADIQSVLDAAVERGSPYQAHNLLGHIRRVFNWAIGRADYGLEQSPCDRMRPALVIGKKLKRQRVLTDREMFVFWRAAGRLKYPFGPVLQLLALTGLRKSEVAEARWSEFDLTNSVWTIPPERAKNDAAHVVPLSVSMLEILRKLPRFNKGDCLFSTTSGRKPVNGFGKAKERLDREMEKIRRALARYAGESAPDPMDHFCIHDIRRSVRTNLGGMPEVPDMVAELIIGHALPGLHQVYNQHSYLSEKRAALEAWEKELRSIVALPKPKVVRLEAVAG